MTVQELIEELQEYAALNPEMEVRLGVQPDYPFECAINGVITNGDLIEEGGEEVCYILQGMQIGYATKKLWNVF